MQKFYLIYTYISKVLQIQNITFQNQKLMSFKVPGLSTIRMTYAGTCVAHCCLCLYNSLLFFQVVEGLAFGSRRDNMAKT